MPALPPEKSASADIRLRSTSAERAAGNGVRGHGDSSTRLELVTAAVRMEDYARLKATGSLHPDLIQMALRRYVYLIRENGWRPRQTSFGWNRGRVVHFPTAIPKGLADEIRNLSGRFDGHTIEAINLLLMGETPRVELPAARKPLWTSLAISGALGACAFVLARVLGQPSPPVTS